MERPSMEAAVAVRLAQLEAADVVERIWARDVSVWSDRPEAPELADRLGWLDLPTSMTETAETAGTFAESVRGEFDRVVLCGMGGSSLAPEVLWRTAGPRDGYLRLHLLDSTHPEAVRRATEDGDLARTLVLVASKSGTTVETRSFERYFWERTGGNAEQFVAITDPGTELASRAQELGYRQVFLSPPDVGGRFSALSPFGLVPAALVGLDPEAVLARAREAVDECRQAVPENPAVRLGALMGEGARQTRDKLLVLLDQRLASLGLWVEQLVAESTGKGGHGVLPVVDRLDVEALPFQDWVLTGRAFGSDGGRRLRAVGERFAPEPADLGAVVDPASLGAEFFRWEFATAVAGAVLGINPFDQPNVAESKANTARVLEGDDIPEREATARQLRAWLSAPGPGDYASVMAYLPPSDETDRQLARVRRAVEERTGVAVTVGYGPRFLHSTGQLHKGGPQRGHFLQIVDPPDADVAIPGMTYGFARLIAAQAEGDLEALRSRERPVLRTTGFTALERVLGL